jgi:hypothetical protein
MTEHKYAQTTEGGFIRTDLLYQTHNNDALLKIPASVFSCERTGQSVEVAYSLNSPGYVSVKVLIESRLPSAFGDMFIPDMSKIAALPAPVTVEEAARVLLTNTGAFSTLVDVAETEHSKGVSFNCVVGRALRALAGEKPNE